MPYGIAITRKQGDEVIRAWRLAHGALSLGGATAITMAAVLSSLKLIETAQWVLATSFIVSGYSFCLALTIEPFVGDRGLAWTGSWLNKFVFVGNVTGALTSLVGTILLVYASYMSL